MNYYDDPASVQVFYDSGSSTMGDLDWPEDGVERCRFSLGNKPFVVRFVRVHFTEGTGTADLVLNVDSHQGRFHDTALWTVKAVGTGADANFRCPSDQLSHFMLGADDKLVLTWANPDDGNINWGAEVGLIEARTDAL